MPIPATTHSISRAWYEDTIANFILKPTDTILGELTKNSDYAIELTQRNAWQAEIELLKTTLPIIDGKILFEYNIPRMGKRVDVVLLINNIVCVIEFKVGETNFPRSAIKQAWDYALDLKNFHEASHHAFIVPIVWATNAKQNISLNLTPASDNVFTPQRVNNTEFVNLFNAVLSITTSSTLDTQLWVNAPYHPTPTIIEAARILFKQHSVEEITRNDAGENISITSRRIAELIDEAQRTRQKYICFITGVPGAGKTLVGLNLATQRADEKENTHAVFLSGNGPLVKVLREALTRDAHVQAKEKGKPITKIEAGKPVQKFIQNIHHFRDDSLKDDAAPAEHVVIFDEAQRAWDLDQTSKFMKSKKGIPNFNQSEPHFLISCMDRHLDWAVIICLVGGGQEINTGEAGISAWIEAVTNNFPNWKMFVSSRITDSEYATGKAVEYAQQHSRTQFEDCLHLAVSMRSFRSERVSAFVKNLLDLEVANAKQLFNEIIPHYPMALTRNLDLAKQWLRQHARGSERYGLLASSKALRLKPDAIDVRFDIDPVHYFLDDDLDPRSSYYLEDAATEFHVQGLELDWACIAWEGDLRIINQNWHYHNFRGKQWTTIQKPDIKNYLKNAYRVLLTRARQGFVIYIPPGSQSDNTR